VTLPGQRRRAPEQLDELDAHPLAYVPDTQLEDLTGVDRAYFRARRRQLGIPPQPKGHTPWLTNLVRSWPRAWVTAWLEGLPDTRASVSILRRRAESLLKLTTVDPPEPARLTAPAPIAEPVVEPIVEAVEPVERPKPKRGPRRGRLPSKVDENGQLVRVQRSWSIKRLRPMPLLEDGSDQLLPLTNAERAELERLRPRTRGDCASVPRPCPWAGCRHHLLFEVAPSGTIHLAAQTLDPLRLQQSCSLDVAERGSLTLEELGVLLNLTRERVRQIEVDGIEMLRRKSRADRLRPFADELEDRGDESIYTDGDDE
jgi:hypothetical protein